MYTENNKLFIDTELKNRSCITICVICRILTIYDKSLNNLQFIIMQEVKELWQKISGLAVSQKIFAMNKIKYSAKTSNVAYQCEN